MLHEQVMIIAHVNQKNPAYLNDNSRIKKKKKERSFLRPCAEDQSRLLTVKTQTAKINQIH